MTIRDLYVVSALEIFIDADKHHRARIRRLTT